MRSLVACALVPMWFPMSPGLIGGLLGGLLGGPGVAFAQAAPKSAAKPVRTPTTVVRDGEDCAAVAKRVYGKAGGALAQLQASNPGLCDQPLAIGTTLRTPPLKKTSANEPARLSYVGPAVRTKTRSGWMEALPGQPIDRKMRIETSNVGGAEVNVQDKVKLQLDPNSKMVIKNLPRGGRQSGEVQLVEGTLHAGVSEDPKNAPLTVRTTAGEFKLKGDARIDAAAADRTTVSVHEGSVSVKIQGTVINIRAGQGTMILPGQAAAQPKSLPNAPAWSPGAQTAATPEESSNRPFLVVAAANLLNSQPKGEVEVDFAPVAGASRYNVEIARDPSFNDHRAGGEITAPPLRAQLQPGRYYARVSALDNERLVGPPSAVRSFYVITLRSDASVVGIPVQNGGQLKPNQHGAQMMLVRSLSTTLQLSGVGQPLQVAIDDALPIDCRNERAFTLGPGEHHVRLRLGEAESELLFSVAGAPPPAPVEVEADVTPMEIPVPLLAPGFPGRSMQPRTRMYALLGVGSSVASRDVNIFRLDIGGEIALLQRRLSFDVNVPLLYYTGLDEKDATSDVNSVAIGDVSFGLRSVAVKGWNGRLLFGPMLHLQVPTGSFDRNEAPNRPLSSQGHPVTVDTALGLALQLGRFGLQTTQGLPVTVNLPQTQLRWAMNYSADVKLGRVNLMAALDAAVGALGQSPTGTALSGGVRLRLGPWSLLTGARGGLGGGGIDVFGRYYVFLGAEWSPP